jgi:multisubunit Na+/H+ antiporter MnhB subunit
LAGMVFSGAFTFLMMGFSPFRLARKGLLISLFMVGVISAPLALGFTRMVRENRIIQRLSGKEIQNGVLRDVRVLQMNPIKISITLVSENSVDLEEIKQIKEEIIEMIGEDVQIELMVGIQL